MISKKIQIKLMELYRYWVQNQQELTYTFSLEFNFDSSNAVWNDTPVTNIRIEFNNQEFMIYINNEADIIDLSDTRTGEDYISELLNEETILVMNNVTIVTADELTVELFIENNFFAIDTGSIGLILFKQNTERIKLKKDLTFVGIISGNFTNSVMVKTPVIDIENFTLTDTYNYVRIINLNRYYYVDSVELISKDIKRLNLIEDVLYSHDKLIRKQKAFVTRNQYRYNRLLPDERRKGTNKFTTETITIPDTPSNQRFKTYPAFAYDYTYDPDTPTVRRTFPIIVLNAIRNVAKGSTRNEGYIYEAVSKLQMNVKFLVGSGSYHTYDNIFPLPSYSDSTPFLSPQFLPCVISSGLALYYDRYGTQLAKLLLKIRNDDNIRSKVGSIRIYPISFYDEIVNYSSNGIFKDMIITLSSSAQLEDELPRFQDLEINGTDMEIKVTNIFPKSPYILMEDFIFTESFFTDYNELNPYALYEIFLPFVGWKELDIAKLINHRILVFYTIDFTSGDSTAFIYDYTAKCIIDSSSCVMGIEIPLTTTNAKEVKDKQDSNILNMILGGFGSALSIGVGVATMNPVAVAGGTLSLGKTVGTYFQNEKTNYQRGQVAFGSNGTAVLSPQKVSIRRKVEILNYSITDTDFLSKEGGVCNELLNISELTGYTEFGDIHFELKGEDIYNDEVNEIISLLHEGVIL